MRIRNNQQRRKRILWLLNHTTLRDGEVPMLIRLGFEVYVPKKFPFDEANQSASISYAYDSSLTIDPSLLLRLNNFDFYSKQWPAALSRAINQNFDAVILPIFPKMVHAACASFIGPIFLRVFGLEGNQTYSEVFKTRFSQKTCEYIQNSGQVWLATSNPTIIDNEPQWMRRIAIHLPLGMPRDFILSENQWHGEKKQILFVCPRINSHPYYAKIYKSFKKNFNDLPHIIVGAQPVAVDDPFVTDFLPQQQYAEVLKSSRVMFYHSTEERHLHYHPLEAIVYGMPVVFMSGGVLEFLARDKLPGCCDTLEEARKKIRRILEDDREFIAEVVTSQKILLGEFETQYVEDSWKQRFSPLLEPRSGQPGLLEAEEVRNKTSIGIWVHETNPNGFTGEGISRLLAMIVRGGLRQDIRFHIAAVSWVKPAILNYMGDLGVDTRQLSFELVDEKPPFVFQVYKWWTDQGNKPRRKVWSMGAKLRGFISWAKSELGGLLFMLRPNLGLPFALLFAVISLPFVLIIGLTSATFLIIKGLFEGIAKALRMDVLVGAVKEFILKSRSLLFELAPRVYSSMVNVEMKLLARKVSRNSNISAWFFPYPINKYLDYFSAPTIVAVPDIVFIDFPSRYSRQDGIAVSDSFLEIKKTISKADAIVVFSDYVRDHQIGEHSRWSRENIAVIRHAPIDTRSIISDRDGVRDDEIRILAKRVIRNYLQNQHKVVRTNHSRYLGSLNLGAMDYLFVSSQSRLHKNHLNLLKAYRSVLREKYVNLKLIFSGIFSEEMSDFIKSEKLHLDVLSMHYMPPVVHASFYACAKLTIVPSLFEGGFPFVFSESLSVKTPVLLSNIPAVSEMLTDEEKKRYCFDPYNTQEIATKILDSLGNLDYLLDLQGKTLARMKLRSWEDVAREYIQVFLQTKKTT